MSLLLEVRTNEGCRILPKDTFARKPKLLFVHEFPFFDIGDGIDRLRLGEML